MVTAKRFWPLATLACLALAGAAHAQTVGQIARDPMGLLHTLEIGTDPATVAVRRQIEGGPADLARARAAIAEEKVSLDPASLQKPLPPPDLNAAPLYDTLFQLLRAKPLNLPKYAQPLVATQTYTPDQLAAVQRILDSRADVFTLLHQAADRPQCVFTRRWADGPGVLFPEIATIREAARLLNTESFLLAAQGKYAEAVKNQRRGFRVAQHAASDPILISYLVGVACEAITLNGMRGILALAGPNAAVDEAVRQAVEANRPRLSLRYALTGELVTEEVVFQQMRGALEKDGLRAMAASLEGPGDPIVGRLVPGTPADRRLAGAWLDESESIVLTRMRALLAAADLPPGPRGLVFAQQDAQAAGLPTLVNLLAKMFLPTFTTVNDKETTRVALENVLIAASAVLSSASRTGTYPETLPEPFPDPYSGKPLLYRRAGPGAFVVYSAGPSGKYDGGEPASRQAVFRFPLLRTPAPAQ